MKKTKIADGPRWEWAYGDLALKGFESTKKKIGSEPALERKLYLLDQLEGYELILSRAECRSKARRASPVTKCDDTDLYTMQFLGPLDLIGMRAVSRSFRGLVDYTVGKYASYILMTGLGKPPSEVGAVYILRAVGGWIKRHPGSAGSIFERENLIASMLRYAVENDFGVLLVEVMRTFRSVDPLKVAEFLGRERLENAKDLLEPITGLLHWCRNAIREVPGVYLWWLGNKDLNFAPRYDRSGELLDRDSVAERYSKSLLVKIFGKKSDGDIYPKLESFAWSILSYVRINGLSCKSEGKWNVWHDTQKAVHAAYGSADPFRNSIDWIALTAMIAISGFRFDIADEILSKPCRLTYFGGIYENLTRSSYFKDMLTLTLSMASGNWEGLPQARKLDEHALATISREAYRHLELMTVAGTEFRLLLAAADVTRKRVAGVHGMISGICKAMPNPARVRTSAEVLIGLGIDWGAIVSELYISNNLYMAKMLCEHMTSGWDSVAPKIVSPLKCIDRLGGAEASEEIVKCILRSGAPLEKIAKRNTPLAELIEFSIAATTSRKYAKGTYEKLASLGIIDFEELYCMMLHFGNFAVLEHFHRCKILKANFGCDLVPYELIFDETRRRHTNLRMKMHLKNIQWVEYLLKNCERARKYEMEARETDSDCKGSALNLLYDDGKYDEFARLYSIICKREDSKWYDILKFHEE